jgi:lysophospholipase L1-like esterase
MGNGLFRGFAALLAEALGGPSRVRLVNTGRTGARVACVRREQVPVALRAQPNLAVLLVGLNDTLRSDFDTTALCEDLTGVVSELAASGATVLLTRFHHHGKVFPLPGFLARALDSRIDELNAVIDRVAGEQTAHCLDLAAVPASYQPSTWSVDRLHPSEHGHRLLARAFAELLLVAGHPVPRLHSLDGADGPIPTRAQQAHWLLTRGTPWLYRRSRDLLPVALAAATR